MSENKVLIIGAGLGGLVLAHVLTKNKVPVEIFERDDHSSSRKQGWAVALIEYVPQPHTTIICNYLSSKITFPDVCPTSNERSRPLSSETSTPTASITTPATSMRSASSTL